MPTGPNSQSSYCWAASGKGVIIKIWLELRRHHSLGNLPAPPHCLGVGPGTCQGNARELTQGGSMEGNRKPSYPSAKRGDKACCDSPVVPNQTTNELCVVSTLKNMKLHIDWGHQQTVRAWPYSLNSHLPAKTHSSRLLID